MRDPFRPQVNPRIAAVATFLATSDGFRGRALFRSAGRVASPSAERQRQSETRASAVPVAGDELGAYTHEQLIKMDLVFVAAVETAIRRGLERPPEEGSARAAGGWGARWGRAIPDCTAAL
jgi:hypothetical protein